MSERTRFLGLDAHALTIAVGVADEIGAPSERSAVTVSSPTSCAPPRRSSAARR
jgi:hypothetical protein